MLLSATGICTSYPTDDSLLPPLFITTGVPQGCTLPLLLFPCSLMNSHHRNCHLDRIGAMTITASSMHPKPFRSFWTSNPHGKPKPNSISTSVNNSNTVTDLYIFGHLYLQFLKPDQREDKPRRQNFTFKKFRFSCHQLYSSTLPPEKAPSYVPSQVSMVKWILSLGKDFSILSLRPQRSCFFPAINWNSSTFNAPLNVPKGLWRTPHILCMICFSCFPHTNDLDRSP